MDRDDEILEVLALVKEMRWYQKQYFKTRDKEVLIKSKQLEACVDEKLAELKI
jgi:hypothetical protein